MKKVIALHTHVGNDNNNQQQQTMTSLEIAELTGKQHFHVMEAIRKMEPAWVKVNESKFRLVTYKDQKGELRPCYQLTKTECLYIATKFNDEARAKLVLRWDMAISMHHHPVVSVGLSEGKNYMDNRISANLTAEETKIC